MATTSITDAVVVPQDPGTGISSNADPNSAAIAALLAKYQGGTYVPSDGGLGFTVDTNNNLLDVGQGYCFIVDDVSDTSNSRGSGGRPQVQSTTTSGYDTELPDATDTATNVYLVIVPTDYTGLSLDAGSNDVYLSVDVSGQNTATLEYGSSVTPSTPNIQLGTANSDDGGTTRPNDNVAIDARSVSADELLDADVAGAADNQILATDGNGNLVVQTQAEGPNPYDQAQSFTETDLTINHTNTQVADGSIELSGSQTSGNALIMWDKGVPTDIFEYDIATYTETPDGETVTVDVETAGFGTVDDFESGNLVVEADPWGDWSNDTGNLSAQQSTVLAGSWSGEFTSANENVNVDLVRNPAAQIRTVELLVQIDNQTGNGSDAHPIRIRSGSDLASGLQFNGDGSLQSPPGSDISGSWSAGTLYKVILKNHDYSADTYDLELIDEDASSTVVSETGLNFDTSVADADTIRIQNYTGASGGTVNVYLDAIQSNVFQTEFSDISRNFDISSISTDKNVKLRANLSRNDTSNNPTLDSAYRSWLV
jgi:hypothetical protein